MKCPTCGWDKQAGGSAKTRKGFAVTGPSVADRKKAAQTRARNTGKPFYCGVSDCRHHAYCKRNHRALRPCGRANPFYGDYSTRAANAKRRACKYSKMHDAMIADGWKNCRHCGVELLTERAKTEAKS